MPDNMVMHPLIARELRAALRKKSAQKSRAWAAWIGGGTTVAFLLLNTVGFNFPLHTFLFFIGLYYAVTQTFTLTADMFTAERENEALGLLFLAGLNVREIFITKIAGHFLVTFNNLLALAPFIAVAFLSGGVSFSLFGAIVCCLPAIMIFCLALSTLGSAMCDEESTGMTVAIIIGLLISFLIPALSWLGNRAGGNISSGWFLLTPAYGPWLIYNGLNFRVRTDFWQNISITLLWSVVFFVLAAVLFHLSWRQKVVGEKPWRQRLRRWLRGSEAYRRDRVKWLETNPFVWLATHDRQPQQLAACVITGLVAIWFLGWTLLPRVWVNVPNFLFLALSFNLFLNWINYYAAARTVAELRRKQTIEHLLTTPLRVEQIVDGQIEALRIQFRKIKFTALILNLCMVLVGLCVRSWNWRALAEYFMIWAFFIGWSQQQSIASSLTALWAGLVTGRPMLAANRLIGGMSYLWQFYNFRFFFNSLAHFPSGSVTEFVIVTFVAIIFLIIYVYQRKSGLEAPLMRGQLIDNFRKIATEPLPEANDPRLKNWKINERLGASSDLLRV